MMLDLFLKCKVGLWLANHYTDKRHKSSEIQKEYWLKCATDISSETGNGREFLYPNKEYIPKLRKREKNTTANRTLIGERSKTRAHNQHTKTEQVLNFLSKRYRLEESFHRCKEIC